MNGKVAADLPVFLALGLIVVALILGYMLRNK